MALSTWTLSRSSLVLIEGDSLTDVAFPYQMQQPLIETVVAAVNPSAGPGQPGQTSSAWGPYPRFVNKAVNGANIGDINNRIAAELTQNPYTHVMLFMGTNERAILRATTQANIASLAAKFSTQKVLIVGPYAWGEKWPSGTNNMAGANDQRLDETDVDIPAGFAANYPNFIYVSLRTTLYATLAPGPGADVGPNTVDGIHWNPRGRYEAFKIWRPAVSLG